MKELIARTRALFAAGRRWSDRVSWRLRVDLDLFRRGGLTVLDAIETIGYDTLHRRPAIGRADRARLLSRALSERFAPCFAPANRMTMPRRPRSQGGMPEALPLDRSLEHCRRTARIAARNFYYGFRCSRRRNATRYACCTPSCAAWTIFQTNPEQINEKTTRLAECRARMDQALAGDISGDPVWPAFRHVLNTFDIPARYLHDLIPGAEMDLTVSRYATFADLREYCYRVAGTVGSDVPACFRFPRSARPDLAESSWTRLSIDEYPPRYCQRFRDGAHLSAAGRPGVVSHVRGRSGRGPLTPNCGLLAFEAERAWSFYGEGAPLVRFMDADSRRRYGRWRTIYSRHAGKHRRAQFRCVFCSAISFRRAEKIGFLLTAGENWMAGTEGCPRKACW